MAAKYYVWGEGVWRELDVAAGRVAGWRRHARFVFVRRGRLQVARRRAVLRALTALAARLPSAAADGPRLDYLRKSVVSHKRPAHFSPVAAPVPPTPVCEHHHCCAHFNGYKVAVAPPAPAPAAPRREAGTQCGRRDAGTSTERALTFSVAPPAPPAPPARAATDSSADEFVSTYVSRRAARDSASDVSALLGAPPAPPSPRARSKRALEDCGEGAPRHKRPARAASASTSADEGGAGARAVCKELIISEAHVAALRGFVARTRPSALARFDADDAYKRALFYAINPLVELRPCARLERLLHERDQAALPHFAARLGLTPTRCPPAPRPTRSATAPRSARTTPAPATRPAVTSPAALRPAARRPRPPPSPRKRPSAEADTDKENKDKHSSPNKVRSGAAALKVADTAGGPRGNKGKGAEATAAQTGGDTDEEALRAKRRAVQSASGNTHVISKRAMGHKEYSNLEDHAIVAWVSVGARASQVKGNALWRRLQEQFPRLGGAARSWHSLRNRYLRYILPALHQLRLEPGTEARLRAAAAAGTLRTQARAAAGLGALPRRNSLFAEAPRGAASRRLRATSTASGDSSDDSETPARQPAGASPGGKAGGSRAARSPRYSEVTRRFAARRAVSSSSASPSPRAPSPRAPSPAPVTRSRKLFNPNSNV